MEYPSFLEHLRARYGPNWCVATRVSGKTAKYDPVITPTKYEREKQAWAAAHPATLLAQTLPDGPEKRLICKALQRELS